MVLLHVVADGAHQLLVKAHKSGMTLQFFDMTVVVASRATGVRLLFEAVTTSTSFLFLVFNRIFDGLDLLEHLEHVILFILLAQMVL